MKDYGMNLAHTWKMFQKSYFEKSRQYIASLILNEDQFKNLWEKCDLKEQIQPFFCFSFLLVIRAMNESVSMPVHDVTRNKWAAR